ncbi:hypothetical protein EX30DRAFT_350955 [Ascodesmis nigricans]|uniref:Uncharacterized protein n=1 Tax=Ascodesmis nigricans TaxID=341454 RepID=A0A4S2MNI6_9PEZI|nr:hypothetical protein EX30DRAFT_350955 [Ascodesmis nigricans]
MGLSCAVVCMWGPFCVSRFVFRITDSCLVSWAHGLGEKKIGVIGETRVRRVARGGGGATSRGYGDDGVSYGGYGDWRVGYAGTRTRSHGRWGEEGGYLGRGAALEVAWTVVLLRLLRRRKEDENEKRSWALGISFYRDGTGLRRCYCCAGLLHYHLGPYWTLDVGLSWARGLTTATTTTTTSTLLFRLYRIENTRLNCAGLEATNLTSTSTSNSRGSTLVPDYHSTATEIQTFDGTSIRSDTLSCRNLNGSTFSRRSGELGVWHSLSKFLQFRTFLS